MKTIDVDFKEWFDRVNGNSYCAGTVTIDYGMPTEEVITCPFTYGYGDYYIQEASEALRRKGYIKADKYIPLWRYCEENDIILRADIKRRCLKRELVAFSK